MLDRHGGKYSLSWHLTMWLIPVILSASNIIFAHAATEPPSSRALVDHIAQVSLQRNGKQFGVGVIVGFHFVAAPWSIIQNIPNDQLKILTYPEGTDHPPAIYGVKAKKPHFNYAVKSFAKNVSRPVHNIALVQIDGEFDLSDASLITDAEFPPQGSQPAAGTEVTMEGYGPNADPEMANGHVIDPQKCDEYHGGLYEGEICFSGYDEQQPEQSDALCKGDEGTALFLSQTNKLVGFASSIVGCNNASIPIIFTDFGYHRNWIDRNMVLMHQGEPHQNDSWWSKFWSGRKGPSHDCRVGTDGETLHEWDCQTACEEKKAGSAGCTYNVCCCYNGTVATSYNYLKYGRNDNNCLDIYSG